MYKSKAINFLFIENNEISHIAPKWCDIGIAMCKNHQNDRCSVASGQAYCGVEAGSAGANGVAAAGLHTGSGVGTGWPAAWAASRA